MMGVTLGSQLTFQGTRLGGGMGDTDKPDLSLLS